MASDLSLWYFSVILNDTVRGRNYSTVDFIELRPFLSTGPDVRNASVCIYQFSPQNATLTGSGANDTGCAGVLSDTCTAYLKEGSRNTTRSNSLPGDRCGTLSVAQEDLKRRDEACGREKFSTIVASKLTKAPRAH